MVEPTVPMIGNKGYDNSVLRDEGAAASMRALDDAVRGILRENHRQVEPASHADRVIALRELARRGDTRVPARYREGYGSVQRMSEPERALDEAIREAALRLDLPPAGGFRNQEQTERVLREVARRRPELAPRRP
jgi:hypothetical protein